MTEICVPEGKFEELGKKSSVTSIANGGTCKIVAWQNSEYVVTGAKGTGTGFGWAEIYAHKVVDFASYKEDLKPLERKDHNAQVRDKKRERGYNGMIVREGKRKLVVIGQSITFKKSGDGKQLSFF